MKPQLFVSCLFVVGMSAAPVAQDEPAPVVTFHDAAGKQLVAADVVVERLHTGMRFVEGPVWLAAENALVFSDIPRAKLLRWTAKDGVVDWRDSEQSNGNTLDLQGRLLSAQHKGRNVIRHGKDGKVEILAAACGGKKFNSPNDLAVRKDGSIWFTDPTYGLRKRKKEAEGNFVYRLDGKTGAVTIVQRDFAMPNGICFAPDHERIYIADSGKKQRVGAFQVAQDGRLSQPLFWLAGGADGIRCDARGNLYTTARDGVRIYSEAGKHLVTVRLPEQPANCAFGGPEGTQLFVTARTSLYRLQLRVPGAPIPPGVRASKSGKAAGTKR